MSGLWERFRNRLTRTESKIEKIRAEEDKMRLEGDNNQKPLTTTTTTTTNQNTSGDLSGGSSPWDLMEAKKQAARIKLPPPELLWMQSPYVRGSTQKLTDMTRLIIGLPLDAALLQMHFSPKKMSDVVETVLAKIKLTLRFRGANPAEYYIKTATVGRGTYLKRLEIRGRGQRGIQWRGHAFVRICVYKPDPKEFVKKMLKVKHIPREDKPIMKKIDYS